MKQCYPAARPVILEPIMLVELKAPTEFQGTVTGDINKWVYLFICHNNLLVQSIPLLSELQLPSVI